MPKEKEEPPRKAPPGPASDVAERDAKAAAADEAKSGKKSAADYLGPRLPEPQMVLDAKSYELKQLAREIAEREADPLDESKRKGGYFLNEQGVPIDAEGNLIPEDEVDDEHKKAAKDARKAGGEG